MASSTTHSPLPPLPTTFNPDGKSLYNPPGPQSSSYHEFPKPIDSSNNGFDFHIYYMSTVESEMKYARDLHDRIRREFPELRIYRFWDKPVGPHPTAMFEVNTFNPHQTGALFSWLTVNRGPCSLGQPALFLNHECPEGQKPVGPVCPRNRYRKNPQFVPEVTTPSSTRKQDALVHDL